MRALAAVMLLAAAPAFAGFHDEHSVRVVAPVKTLRLVTISIPAGGFVIRNGASDRIIVDGVVGHEDVGIAIDVRGDHATIYRTFGPDARNWGGRHAEAELTIDVPANVDVDAQTHFGEVRLDGAFGDIDVHLRAGEVDVRTPRANVGSLSASSLAGEVHANLGDRVVTREGLFAGRMQFSGSGKSDVSVHVMAGEVRVTLTP